VSGPPPELLLSLQHEEGVASVHRDPSDGSYWLSSTGEDRGSNISNQRGHFEGLRERWVVGGFTPAGASRAHVRDAHGSWGEAVIGNGVWLGLSRAMPLAVRFEDASGGIVPHPPDAIEREPAPDAVAPCAACGATAWDLALLAPEQRAVVCRRCGHHVTMGVFYAGEGEPMDPQPPDDWRRQRAAAQRQLFADVRFPVYGLAGWLGERSWTGHGTSMRRGLDQISLTHGSGPSVEVETYWEEAHEPPVRQLERALMRHAVQAPAGEDWQRLSPAAITVLLEERELRGGERVGAVVTHEVTIAVDGRRQRFLAGRIGDAWAALATLDHLQEITILISADRIPPGAVALERIHDIEPYLERAPR
jgi:hypothetical protein